MYKNVNKLPKNVEEKKSDPKKYILSDSIYVMYKMHKPINAVRRQDNGFSQGKVAGIWKG